MRIIILLTISFLSFFSISENTYLRYLNREVIENNKKGFGTIIISEKVSFEIAIKTLKGHGIKKNDGSIIKSGSKYISNEEFKKLEEKFSSTKEEFWSKNNFDNADITVLSEKSLEDKIKSKNPTSKSFIYYLSNEYTTSDGMYKFFYVSKSPIIQYYSPIISCVHLYKKNKNKWELVEKIDSSEIP